MVTTDLSPAAQIYIPFLYIIWADGLLTASELSVIRSVISDDPHLRGQEKTILLDWLHPGQPPAETQFEEWKQLIELQNASISLEEEFPLASFSSRFLPEKTSSSLNIQGLEKIEYNLGIQPNQYKHLFTVDIPERITESSFSEQRMSKVLKGKYATTIKKVQVLTENELFDWTITKDKTFHRQKVSAQLQEVGKHGLGAVSYSPDYGGKSDLQAYGHIFEQLMFVDGSLAVKFGVQFGLFGGSVFSLGTKKHHDKWLNKLGQGKLLGCFAMTEERHGSNVRGLKTTATYIKENDTIEINTPSSRDYKVYIGNALEAKMATVFAQLIVNGTNEGVHAIVVPIRDESHNLLPGIKVEDNGYKHGLNGVDNGKIWFDSVQVPVDHLLDQFGHIKDGKYSSNIKNPDKRFFTTLGTLAGGRICVGKGANAAAKLALTIAIKYALKRRQFGSEIHKSETAIIDYPTHQMRLFPRLAKTYAIHFALEDAMSEYSALGIHDDKRKLETQIAALKSIATWHANQTVQECREACGGKGYMSENRIPDLKSDIDIFTTFEGDNYVLLQLAAKGVLSEFQTDFNAEHFTGVIKFLRRKWSDLLVSYNPIFTSNIDLSHLYSRSFHMDAFSYRRRRLTFSIAQRINNLFKKRVKPYQAFLKVQTHMINLAKAYGEELILISMHKVISETEDEDVKFMLKKLSALYALSTILEHKGWYLEQGYISAKKSKAIRQLVHRHAQQLVPDVNALVNAFGIPGKYINLPIMS
ncbi:acyl-CoA dehydrogenase family protein [Membranihabitans maritimus]|uniref:acyl-CoA dehydrogenase family protein n=1 Tax=Membranihabitans maritimus TaxID=2904244 RepID=UPI001F3C5BA6|nr:acyl-CoA dehydrogenase [Membranihabitans maritimus]